MLLPLDRRYDPIALLALLGTMVLLALEYGTLPERIPTHFNGAGEPNDWSAKATLLLLPTLALFLYVTMGWAAKLSPNTTNNLNYTFIPHPGKEALVRRLTHSMLGYLRAVICLSFGYLILASIRTAQGRWSGLGDWFLLAFMGLLFGGMIYYLVRTSRHASLG